MINLFNKWGVEGIKVLDPGLKDYINLRPLYVVKTGGRNTKVRFHKNKNNIVERLINHLMIPGHRGKKHKISSGHCSGKGQRSYNMVKKAFEIIEGKLGKNPVEVFVKALENAAPREEITAIEYGGARYPQAVDCAPQRRVDVAMRMMVQGAYSKSFNSKKKFVECLAEEIINAYNCESKSTAVSKKLELERQADSSR